MNHLITSQKRAFANRKFTTLQRLFIFVLVAISFSHFENIGTISVQAANAPQQYISSLAITFDREGVPTGFTKLKVDLNKKARGKAIYLCYQTTTDPANAITDIKILLGERATTPQGYTKINRDLNAGAGGEFIFLSYTKNRASGGPIRQLVLDACGFDWSDRSELNDITDKTDTISDFNLTGWFNSETRFTEGSRKRVSCSESIYQSNGYVRSPDLNKGCGGHTAAVVLYYKR